MATRSLWQRISAEGLNQAGGFDVAVGYVKDVDPQKLVGYDALVYWGAKPHGKPSWTMRKFVDSLCQQPFGC